MRLLKSTFTIVTVITCCLSAVTPNAHATPLRDAASEYKHAVKKFEIAIYQRKFDRQYKRMIQELEEAAIRMRAASFRPDRLDRLECAWREIQVLHPQVEAAIFSRHATCLGQPDLDLAECWERVNCAYNRLAEELACVCRPHGQFGLTDVAPPPWTNTRATQLGQAYGDRYSSPGSRPRIPFSGTAVDRSRLQDGTPFSPSSGPTLLAPSRNAPTYPFPQQFESFDGRAASVHEPLDRGQLRAALVETILRRMIGG